MGVDSGGVTAQVIRPVKPQTVTVSGVSTATSAFGNNTRVVRIVSTTDCHYAMGVTATTASTFLPATMVEYVSVRGGDTIQFIENSAGGTAYISEGQ